MAERLESGAVQNQQTTTYRFKDKEGKQVMAERKENKDTGEVVHKVDGKTLPEPVAFQPGNYEMLSLALLIEIRDIHKQLLSSINEINYRMDREHPLSGKENKSLIDEET